MIGVGINESVHIRNVLEKVFCPERSQILVN